MMAWAGRDHDRTITRSHDHTITRVITRLRDWGARSVWVSGGQAGFGARVPRARAGVGPCYTVV